MRSFDKVGEIQPDPNWRMPPHRHLLHHEVIVVFKGSMLLKTPGVEHLAKPGDVLFYHQGLIHEEISQATNPVHTRFFGFRTDAPIDLPLRTKDADGRVRQMITWLQRDLMEGREVAQCEPLYEAILDELHRLVSEPIDPWLRKLRQFLREKYASPLTLDQLAKVGGMSRFAFVRKFKRLTGQTPMRELCLLRLEEARHMILTTAHPLKVIAPAVGIGDEFQLSKLFRRHFQLTPREIRHRVSATD